MEKDGFVLVTRSHRRCAKGCTRLTSLPTLPLSSEFDISKARENISDSDQGYPVDNHENANQYFNKLYDIREAVTKSSALSTLSGLLLQTGLALSCAVCYGIGAIGSSYIAQYQLSVLLVLSSHLKTVLVHDPILTSSENALLTQLGFTCLEQNEHCRRPAKEPSLFFMPHCGLALYNNLLFSNWDPGHLSRLVVIGNNFSSYFTRMTDKQMSQQGSYVSRACSIVEELPFPAFPEEEAFNDTAIHYFPLDKLEAQPTSLWEEHTPPPLDENDSEIIL